MRFLSTRGECPPADLRTTLFEGLAPDGGLFVPESYPLLDATRIERLRGMQSGDLAFEVLHRYFDEIPEPDLRALLTDALDFEIPLVEIEPGVHVLELFHGPTLAFKDVGARVMARLMAWFPRGTSEDLTILVATSGDTGSAVAHAFLDVRGTRVVILYPAGKVSRLQEMQFTTLGRNVTALAVDGTFDDCQRLVKQAFADRGLRREKALTSANSINVGRYLPQAFYYFHAFASLPDVAELAFAAPSGNFGNLCAGLVAKRMGLPAARYIAATNVNDVVPDYLETGRFEPRASVTTISNAMDVGNPSNFDRILSLYDNDREAIRADVLGSRHDDDATRQAIRAVYERTGYVLDPHTAVGYLALQEHRAELGDLPIVLIATAHPAKFRDEVERVLGRPVPLPESLSAALGRESLSIPMRGEAAELRGHLLEE